MMRENIIRHKDVGSKFPWIYHTVAFITFRKNIVSDLTTMYDYVVVLASL